MKSTFLIILTMLLPVCRGRDRIDESKSEPARLADVIAQADRIVVFEDGLKDARILFNTTVRRDLEEFRNAAAIVWPRTGSFCLCTGIPTIRLYRGHSELVQLKNFDWQRIGCPFWKEDVLLKSPEKWRAWFKSRNIPLSGRDAGKWDEVRWSRSQPQGQR